MSDAERKRIRTGPHPVDGSEAKVRNGQRGANVHCFETVVFSNYLQDYTTGNRR